MLVGRVLMIDDGLKRKRTVGLGPQDSPAAKKPALETTKQLGTPNEEKARACIRDVFVNYQALLAASDGKVSEPGSFQAVLRAAEGDAAGRRLAARLIPRFIDQYPEHVELAAVALTGLHIKQQNSDGSLLKHIEESTRQDALNGLPSVLQAAQRCGPSGEGAVKHVLEYLLRLLPAAAAAMEEPSEPEEEGEVTASGGTVASIHFLKKVLRKALQLHPVATMTYCCNGLADANRSSGNAGNAQLQQGVRLWLKEYVLKPHTPSRETTPLNDALPGTAAAVDRNGNSNVLPRCCCLKAVLDASQELQAWVMQQAKSRATAHPEVRALLETALQLLPAHAQLAAAKPKLDAPGVAKHPRLPSAASLPNMRHKAPPPNGVGVVNGMEPLSRTLPTPGSAKRERSSLHGKSAGGTAAEPSQWPGQQQQQQHQEHQAHTLRSPPGFPQPPGPICRAESCLLVFNLPQNVTIDKLRTGLNAEEAWIMQQQHGSSKYASACCTYKTVVDAAKAYLKHHGTRRFGAQLPPLVLLFADSSPSSRQKQAAAAEPSKFVWATKDAVGDAESITEDLRTAGFQLNHVHRVNNPAEPGTLLQTPSGLHAANVVRYLLTKHPQPYNKTAAADDQESLPPLPPEPPPPASTAEWNTAATATRQQSLPAVQQQHMMPPLPPGPPPPWVQQQQHHHHLERVASAGSLGRPPSPALPQGHLQQPQHGLPGHADAAAAAATSGSRLRSSPAGGWSGSPSDRQQTPIHNGGSSISSREAHVSRWGPALSSMQQQPAWNSRGSTASGIPGPTPPPGPPPLGPGQAALGLGASPGAAGSSGWHTVSPGSTPQQHGGAAAPPPAMPPGQAAAYHTGHVHDMSLQHRQPPQQQHQGHPGHKPPLNPLRPPAGAVGSRSPAATGPGRILWQGAIVKQSVRMCGVVCLASSAPGHPSMVGLAPEPQHWPEQLLVNFRICVPDAVEQYMQAMPAQRSIRLLLPQNPDADTQQLQQFIKYLTGKDRAGMVKLPALREQSLGPRAVYLIVPKPQVCQQLQVVWDGREVMLIAVVVPQPGTATTGGGSTANRQHRS